MLRGPLTVHAAPCVGPCRYDQLHETFKTRDGDEDKRGGDEGGTRGELGGKSGKTNGGKEGHAAPGAVTGAASTGGALWAAIEAAAGGEAAAAALPDAKRARVGAPAAAASKKPSAVPISGSLDSDEEEEGGAVLGSEFSS